MKNSIIAILADVWKMFAVAFSITTIAVALFSQENLLKSDDPYLIGFAAGGLMAAVAMIHSVFAHVPSLSRYKNAIFASMLAVWCGGWTIYEFMHDGEGDGISAFIAGASLLLGLPAWFLCKLRLPKWAQVASSVLAVALIGIYFYVTMAVIGQSSR